MADTSNSRSSESPYQLYVFCGADELPAVSDASVVRVNPDADTPEAALAAVAATGLTAADLRTRTLFMFGSVPARAALLSYVALSGFAGRLLDFSDLEEVFEVRALLTQLHEAPDAGKVDAAEATLDLSVDAIPEVVTPEMVSSARYGKEFTVKLSDAPAKALEAFVFVAGLRFRGGVERFPLCAFIDGVVTDTDNVRREAASARRSRRTDDRGSLVEPTRPSERTSRLLAASKSDPAKVLTALGSVMNPETGFWRCPRPERHRNGDANPSARLGDDGFRCFRCDVEQVDPLRLVMDAKDLSPDDAADWLLAHL
jgi:hypothetical protein